VRLVHERRAFRAVRDAVRAALAATTAGVPTFGADLPPLSPEGQRRLNLTTLRPAPAHVEPLPALEPAWRPAPSPERDSGPPLERLPILRVVGQIGNTYIIAEGPTGMYMVDQHAAHERVLYEELRGQMAKASVESQLLLDPITIEPSPAAVELLESDGAGLAGLGFAIEPFGPGVYAIRAVPGILRRRDVADAVLGLIEEMAAGGDGDWLERLAITTACHSAIRAGQMLSPEEMRQLIAQLERCTQPRHCAHGRPTMLHLSQGDLEREFGRRA
jgi:DNA mismatch repair protein MutL